MTENENIEWTPSLRDWLRIADFQVAQSFGAAFAAEGLSRRDGMLLRRLAKGPVTTDRDKKLRSLEDRGWAHQRGDGTWELTEDGQAAADRLTARLDELHATIRDAVGDEQYEALASSLESVSRALGWDEKSGVPGRGFGRPGFGRPGFGPGAGVPPFGPWAAWGGRRGFGPGFGRGFGPGFRPEFAGGWEQGHGPWEHHGHHGHHAHHGHGAECGGHGRHGYEHQGHGQEHGHGGAEAAYERGFAAGFAARQSA
jgi:hypothetical protein